MTKTVKIENKEYLLIGVPQADKYYINKIGCLRYSKQNNDTYLGGIEESGPVMSTIDTYLGDYEFILKAPGFTEEEASSVVEKVSEDYYKNYKDFSCICMLKTATESLASLFERENIFFKNPYGDKEPLLKDYVFIGNGVFDGQIAQKYYRDLAKWQEAEKQVVEAVVMLEKIK